MLVARSLAVRVNSRVISGGLVDADPFLASKLAEAIAGHLDLNSISSVNTATKQFVEFCKLRGNCSPFPVQRDWLAAFCLFSAPYGRIYQEFATRMKFLATPGHLRATQLFTNACAF